VLIEGESGVGKELIARAIHGSGARRAKPFVAVNCGAMSETLVESILFGHEKGAFTGATERHPGKFVEADGGTLFLDEVGELPAPAQVRLLRALQEGAVEPVGGRKVVKVDVRIISATNRNLIADVKAGRFHEDLFHRLHVFPLSVPPLRTRREDIPQVSSEEAAVPQLVEPSPAIVASWPDIPADLVPVQIAVPAHSLPLTDTQGDVRPLEDIERDSIRFAISHYRGQMSEVARKLRIGRSTLYRKLEGLGLEDA